MKAPPLIAALAAACLLTSLVSPGAGAQAFPNRPIRLVVPFGAGGITDSVARLVGQAWGGSLGQGVVIENRPGAGGVIAAQAAARAAPDGYTVFMGTVGTQVVNPLIYAKGRLPYAPDTQFVPLGLVSRSPFLLAVGAAVPAGDFREFVGYARQHPGALNYGSAGNASAPHIGIELLKQSAGIKLEHIPFKSGAEAVNAAIGGNVGVVLDAAPVILPQVDAGRLRALVVAGSRRLPGAPGVPTSKEAGLPAFDVSSWNALYVPAGTPPEVVGRLSVALRAALASPVLRSRLAAQGSEPYSGSAQEYAQVMQAEKAKWAAVVSAARITAE